MDLAILCTCSGDVNAAIPSSGSVDKALDEIHNSYEKEKTLYELYDKKKTRRNSIEEKCRLASLPLRNLLGR